MSELGLPHHKSMEELRLWVKRSGGNTLPVNLHSAVVSVPKDPLRS